MYTIYSKQGCTYCHYAEELLKASDLPYNKLTLDEHFTKEELSLLIPGYKTFPQIVHTVDDGHLAYIGGYTDLVKHLKGNDW
jgi:glutaredoxin